MSYEPIIIDGVDVKHVVEAIVFASTEPLPIEKIVECIQREEISKATVKTAIDVLNKNYQEHGMAVRIVKIAGGFQFATHPQYDKWVARLFASKAEKKLSQSSLEVLAIVAYRQPITRSEIEKIRGVNADWTLRSLMEKNLITVVGREDAPGKPLLFGTTKQFLEHFGLDAVSELPKLKEIEDILREDKEFAETMEFDFTGNKLKEANTEVSAESASGNDQEAQVDNIVQSTEASEEKNENAG
ncbi:SMC-Scp complex subunit ScpB [bacterium]|nr:SMC-Scp complex subunit ScpB [bacterium]